jgi:hypothetical protein
MKASTDVFAEVYNEIGGLITESRDKKTRCIKLTIDGDYNPDIGDTIKVIKIKERR